MAGITGQQRTLVIDTTPEAIPGVPNPIPTNKHPEIEGDGFQIGENPVFDSAEIEANLSSQPSPETAGFEPAGTLKIVPAPWNTQNPTTAKSWFNWELSWALLRTAGALKRYTVSEYYPIDGSAFYRRVSGCRADGIKLAWGASNRLACPALSIKGQFPDPYVPGSAPTALFPTMRHWNFTFLGVQAGGVYDNVGAVDSERFLRNIEIDAKNNCSFGPTSYLYRASDGTRIIGAGSIDEGNLDVTGSFETKLETYEWINRCVNGGKGHLRLLGFHSDSPFSKIQDVGGITTDPAVATVDVDVDTGDGSDFEVGDTVYLEDDSAADPKDWKREVLEVSAVVVDTVTLCTQGQGTFESSVGRNQTFSQDSRIYKLGCELLIRELTVSGWNPAGGAKDKIYQKIQYQAGIWVGTHPTHGANYAHKVLDFMVR